MSLLKSIHNPICSESSTSYYQQKDIQAFVDEIVLEHAKLIADIERKKLEPYLLKREIEKKLMDRKDIFDVEGFKNDIFDMIYGYGPLEPYIQSGEYSDIDATRYDYFTAKKNGERIQLPITFSSEESFEKYCRLMIIRQGGVIHAAQTHSRVSDPQHQLRINVSIAPRNATGTALNIRKHPKSAYSYEELMEKGLMDREAYEFLRTLNEKKENLLICGKGAAGKTTLLRTLIENGDPHERVLICESDTEIYPSKKNTIVQRIQKQSTDLYSTTLKKLIKEGLTMSLDTYCIGEITGEEAWPFIQAGYTGHRILGTVHAKSAKDAIDRMLMLTESSSQLTSEHMRSILMDTISAVIFMKNFKIEEIIQLSPVSGFLSLYRRDDS